MSLDVVNKALLDSQIDDMAGALPRFERFVSRDVEDGFLVQELHGLFINMAPDWFRDETGVGRWSRVEHEAGEIASTECEQLLISAQKMIRAPR